MTGSAAAVATGLLAAAVITVPRASPVVLAPAWAGPIARAAPAGYAEGAPLGFSGGFGQQTCHACHFDAEINQRPGRVVLSGVPARFVAGTRYQIAITLTRPGMKLGGFQLAARFENDGEQAGALAPAPGEEPRVLVDSDGTIAYANHRKEGTALAEPDTARWSLIWTAPSSGTPVVFHVAANAADGDGTADGDYVYTSVATSLPR